MTKLILIFLFLGLQNPLPALGIGDNAPAQNQSTNNHQQSDSTNNATQDAPLLTDNGPTHSQSDSESDAGKAKSDLSADGMTVAERLNIRLTIILCLIGFMQCCVYVLQWRAMRISSERGLRAYICVANFSHEAADYMAKITDPFPHGFNIFIKNCGQTPAYKVTAFINWATMAGANQWPHHFSGMTKAVIEQMKKDNRGSASTISSGEISYLEHRLCEHPDGSTFLDAYDKWKADRVTIWIYGAVVYRDIYKREHVTRYCVFLRKSPNPPGFVYTAYDRHTEAD
jgi:hypothetical protein